MQDVDNWEYKVVYRVGENSIQRKINNMIKFDWEFINSNCSSDKGIYLFFRRKISSIDVKNKILEQTKLAKVVLLEYCKEKIKKIDSEINNDVGGYVSAGRTVTRKDWCSLQELINTFTIEKKILKTMKKIKDAKIIAIDDSEKVEGKDEAYLETLFSKF